MKPRQPARERKGANSCRASWKMVVTVMSAKSFSDVGEKTFFVYPKPEEKEESLMTIGFNTNMMMCDMMMCSHDGSPPLRAGGI